MPVAVNVPVELDDVDELDPPSPQETKIAGIHANNRIEKIFFMYKFCFKFSLTTLNRLDGNYCHSTQNCNQSRKLITLSGELP